MIYNKKGDYMIDLRNDNESFGNSSNYNRMINLKSLGNDNEGYLTFFESFKEIPFNIKRVYFTHSVPVGVKRGMHAHKTLQQLLWCPYGKVEVILDDGKGKISYILDSPEQGLLILKGYWRDIFFRIENSVLCVAASDYYNEFDYIRDYNEYLKFVEKGQLSNENKF